MIKINERLNVEKITSNAVYIPLHILMLYYYRLPELCAPATGAPG